MRTSPLLADFIQARGCKPKCEKSLTLPRCFFENGRTLEKCIWQVHRIKSLKKVVPPAEYPQISAGGILCIFVIFEK